LSGARNVGHGQHGKLISPPLIRKGVVSEEKKRIRSKWRTLDEIWWFSEAFHKLLDV